MSLSVAYGLPKVTSSRYVYVGPFADNRWDLLDESTNTVHQVRFTYRMDWSHPRHSLDTVANVEVYIRVGRGDTEDRKAPVTIPEIAISVPVSPEMTLALDRRNELELTTRRDRCVALMDISASVFDLIERLPASMPEAIFDALFDVIETSVVSSTSEKDRAWWQVEGHLLAPDWGDVWDRQK